MKIADNPFYLGIASGRSRELDNTAEAIADFIMEAKGNSQGWILKPDRNVVLITRGRYLHNGDEDFMDELQPVLIQKQMEFDRKLGLIP